MAPVSKELRIPAAKVSHWAANLNWLSLDLPDTARADVVFWPANLFANRNQSRNEA